MGRGVLSIEKGDFGGKIIYLCVFRNLIGKTLYSGRVDKLHSKRRRIEEKADKYYTKVRFVSLQKDPITQKFKFEDCAISYTRKDDLIKFEEEFD